MRVTALWFGHFSEMFPEPTEIELPDHATVREAVDLLSASVPEKTDLLNYCRFAVGSEYAGIDRVLADGESLAILPPMSGG